MKNEKDWALAQKRHWLSTATLTMAKRPGMNPKKLGKLDNHKQEPWKAPLPEFIKHLYEKRVKVLSKAPVCGCPVCQVFWDSSQGVLPSLRSQWKANAAFGRGPSLSRFSSRLIGQMQVHTFIEGRGIGMRKAARQKAIRARLNLRPSAW